MLKKTADFALSLGLNLSAEAAEKLAVYADLVWQKKDFLNLTSVADKNEIFTRHICDGFIFAAFCAGKSAGQKNVSAADMGSGAGYIGLTTAVALPEMKITLVESLEKRCSFLNWAVMKLELKNIEVKCMRLGEKPLVPFDFVTERAMGQLADILPLMAPAVKAGGFLAAYQSQPGQALAIATKWGLLPRKALEYQLPREDKSRYLAVFEKADNK